jgi:hypothetical protein
MIDGRQADGRITDFARGGLALEAAIRFAESLSRSLDCLVPFFFALYTAYYCIYFFVAFAAPFFHKPPPLPLPLTPTTTVLHPTLLQSSLRLAHAPDDTEPDSLDRQA